MKRIFIAIQYMELGARNALCWGCWMRWTPPASAWTCSFTAIPES
ncbi:hypothetical protein ABFY27_05245 [Akkermansia massiliensis]